MLICIAGGKLIYALLWTLGGDHHHDCGFEITVKKAKWILFIFGQHIRSNPLTAERVYSFLHSFDMRVRCPVNYAIAADNAHMQIDRSLTTGVSWARMRIMRLYCNTDLHCRSSVCCVCVLFINRMDRIHFHMRSALVFAHTPTKTAQYRPIRVCNLCANVLRWFEACQLTSAMLMLR